jgi:alpha-glucoside transport system permease protein
VTTVAPTTAEARAEGQLGPAPAERRTSRMVRFVTHGPVAVALVIIGFLWLVPTVGLLVSSFRSAADNTSTGWWTALTDPAQLTLEPYQNLLDDPTIVTAFVNTVLIAVPSSILLVLIASLAAYAFSWMNFWGRDALFLIVVALLVVPIQVALIPVSRLFGTLGIFGSIPGVVLFHVAFGLPFAIFLLRNFFIGIPRELLEAARMDGAGEWKVFYRVVLPLGIPAIASLLIFQFLWVWNDLLVALVFAGSNARPLTAAIREQLRTFGANIDVIAPGAFLQMIVPLAVFFAFQRYFVQGLLAGSQR